MTALTWVCWSITSESQTRLGSRVPCQGRPRRPCRLCQALSFSAKTIGNILARKPESMLAFVLRRLGQALIVMLTVGLIAFSLFRFVGDPVVFMLGQDATDQDRARVTKLLGLDRPFYGQYGAFVVRALQGDFGLSLRQVRAGSTLIVERLPATLELSLVAALFALVAGIPMGVYTALRRRSWLSQFLLAISLVGVSLPTFLIGILLILVFSVQLGWLPSFGRGDTVTLGWWTTGLLTASGLKALILPVITITGLQLGAIIAFAIITETVFQWPGMGLLFIQAVQFADVPVMAAYLCLIALFFVIINLALDLLYYAVDPRLRVQPI